MVERLLRKGASPTTIRAWIVADAVLVGVLLVLLGIQLAGGTAQPEAAGPSQPPASATASAPTTPAPAQPASFRLPSGNIACDVTADGATCTIASIAYQAPAVAGCDGRTGHVLALTAGGVAFACETGPAPKAAGDDVPVLQYGKSTTVGDYTCTSATDGVTCVDATGKGFQLARAAWRELP